MTTIETNHKVDVNFGDHESQRILDGVKVRDVAVAALGAALGLVGHESSEFEASTVGLRLKLSMSEIGQGTPGPQEPTDIEAGWVVPAPMLADQEFEFGHVD
jgi:hypothetical protein